MDAKYKGFTVVEKTKALKRDVIVKLCMYHYDLMISRLNIRVCRLTLKVLVTTIDALGHFETG